MRSDLILPDKVKLRRAMSVELRDFDMHSPRHLRDQEIGLLAAMLRAHPQSNEIISSLPDLQVEDMSDGGMGSLRFVQPDDRHRRFGKELVEVEFNDADDVLVSAVINLDKFGRLFELDIWKVDCSPLKRYPSPQELRFKLPAP